jgi:8-oxo-dGTP diphosphatase
MIIPVVAAVLRNEHGQLLLAERPAGKHLAGLWEFPGGKLEPEETPGQGLKREIAEELGIRVLDSSPLLTLTHHYDDRSVRLMLRETHVWEGNPVGLEGQQLKWVSLEQAQALPMPAADRPIIRVMGLEPRLTAIPKPTECVSKHHFLAALETALRAGARLVHVSMPSVLEAQARQLAQKCADLIRGFNARWILECSPELAGRVRADGVVLRADKLREMEDCRVEEDVLCAVECATHDDLRAAARWGADFALLAANLEQCASLIADSPLPVFVSIPEMSIELAAARRLGAYGVCAQALGG